MSIPPSPLPPPSAAPTRSADKDKIVTLCKERGLPGLTISSGAAVINAEKMACNGDGWMEVDMARDEFAGCGEIIMVYRDALDVLTKEYKHLYKLHGRAPPGESWTSEFHFRPFADEAIGTVRAALLLVYEQIGHVHVCCRAGRAPGPLASNKLELP